MQIEAGLDAYIPTVAAGLADKPDTAPDETAILFWDSQQTYQDGFKTLAVRTYTLTHGAVYTPASGAAFPLPFAGALAANQPYYLLDRASDWMHTPVRHLIGSRPDHTAPNDFRTQIARIVAAADLDGLGGAIVCAGDDYLVCWQQPAAEASPLIDALAACTGWQTILDAAPTPLEADLWDQWPGLTIGAGTSLNLQFKRRWERPHRSTLTHLSRRTRSKP